MAYKIRINTSKFQSKKRRSIEMQIHNDICVKLNGKEWTYKTIKGVIERLKVLTGGVSDKISTYSDNNLMVIQNEVYGKLEVKKALPSLCNGYIDWDWLEKQLQKDKHARISFSNFYEDSNFVNTLGIYNCYIEIFEIKNK